MRSQTRTGSLKTIALRDRTRAKIFKHGCSDAGTVMQAACTQRRHSASADRSLARHAQTMKPRLTESVVFFYYFFVLCALDTGTGTVSRSLSLRVLLS
eukprot:scaffold4750_cov140-Isochrysis_galbana.AAC.5